MSLFGEPPWLVMWVLCGALFALCKALTWQHAPPAPRWKRLGYLVAWPGFDVHAFLTRSAKAPRLGEWLFAVAKLLLGAVILWIVVPLVPVEQSLLSGWIGMAGIVFLLHFGAFHVLSCVWRAAGVEAKPLMNWPILATSLADFWSRRWNTAFRDLTHRFLFAPLAARVGPRAGLAIGFLGSGLVHDLVISLPAGGGYGLPTLYFVLQGLGLLVERRVRPLRSRAFTALFVIAPAYGLFHPPFVERVVLPFLAAIGVVE